MIKRFTVVLFTGDRDWTRRRSVRRVITKLQRKYKNNLAVISGGARGLDTIAEQLCKKRGIPFARVDAQWDFYGLAAGPIRNSWMLRFCKIREAHAFHPDITRSKGTRDMVTHCQRKNIPYTIHTK